MITQHQKALLSLGEKGVNKLLKRIFRSGWLFEVLGKVPRKKSLKLKFQQFMNAWDPMMPGSTHLVLVLFLGVWGREPGVACWINGVFIWYSSDLFEFYLNLPSLLGMISKVAAGTKLNGHLRHLPSPSPPKCKEYVLFLGKAKRGGPPPEKRMEYCYVGEVEDWK